MKVKDKYKEWVFITSGTKELKKGKYPYSKNVKKLHDLGIIKDYQINVSKQRTDKSEPAADA